MFQLESTPILKGYYLPVGVYPSGFSELRSRDTYASLVFGGNGIPKCSNIITVTCSEFKRCDDVSVSFGAARGWNPVEVITGGFGFKMKIEVWGAHKKRLPEFDMTVCIYEMVDDQLVLRERGGLQVHALTKVSKTPVDISTTPV